MGFVENFFLGFTSIIFPLMSILIFSIVVITLIRNIRQWNYNNKQPVLSVVARVVAKRTNVSRHGNNTHSTSYYVTFEVESGDRIEFKVPGEEYGMLAEGDVGKLTFQGTKFIKYERAV
ncbi:MAG TPA: DUF2500 domain-containing protein [Tissierellaceae bacterium]